MFFYYSICFKPEPDGDSAQGGHRDAAGGLHHHRGVLDRPRLCRELRGGGASFGAGVYLPCLDVDQQVQGRCEEGHRP